MTTDADREAGLQFPLDWQGKVLAEAAAVDVPERIREVLRSFGLTVVPTTGNTSATGRYLTYTVHAVITDRPTLQQVTYALARIPGVRYVL